MTIDFNGRTYDVEVEGDDLHLYPTDLSDGECMILIKGGFYEAQKEWHPNAFGKRTFSIKDKHLVDDVDICEAAMALFKEGIVLT